MPELPEVETVRNTLKLNVIGQKILDVKVNYPSIVVYPNIEDFKKELINKEIIDIKRRGKWLMFDLGEYYLLSHLRMEGKYNIKPHIAEINKHEHIIFVMKDFDLRYQDTRKFGRMYLYKKSDVYTNEPLASLGLEPWDNKLTTTYLKEKYQNKKKPIKEILLDQSIVVGIGNIYADEILFLARINPYHLANQLNDLELENIIGNTKKVLDGAIKDGGTTIRTYTSSEGVHGRFQQHLQVHSRDNGKCYICNNDILRVKIGGRSTYYCPNCQK